MPHHPLEIDIEEVASTTKEPGYAWFIHHLTDPLEIAPVTHRVEIVAKEVNQGPEMTTYDKPRPGALYSSANQVEFAETEAEAQIIWEDRLGMMRPNDEVRLYKYQEDTFDYTGTIRPLLADEVVFNAEHGCQLVDTFHYQGFRRFSAADRAAHLTSGDIESLPTKDIFSTEEISATATPLN